MFTERLKIIMVIIGVVFILIFLLCDENEYEHSLSNGQRLHFKECLFSIIFPEGWLILENLEINEIQCLNMTKFGTGKIMEKITINCQNYNTIIGLDEILILDSIFYNANLGLKEFLDSLIVDADTQIVILDNVKAQRILGNEIPPGSTDTVSSLSYRFAIDTWQYDINCSTDADNLNHYLNIFEDCVKSFKFAGGK